MKNYLYEQYLALKKYGIEITPIYSEIDITTNGEVDLYDNQLVYLERRFKYSTDLINHETQNQTSWENAVGIGLLIGQNDVRCLKIENAYPSDIQFLLTELRLPLNYSWIIRRPLGNYYIIFKAKHFMIDFDFEKLVQEYNNRSEFFIDKRKFYDISGLDFEVPKHDNLSLRLIWKYSLLFISLIKEANYDLSFAFGDIPNTPPIFLPSRWLDPYFRSKEITGKRFVYTPEYYLDCDEDRLNLNENEFSFINEWRNIPYGDFHFELATEINNVIIDIKDQRDMDYSYLFEVLFIHIEYAVNNSNFITISWIWKCLSTNNSKQGFLTFYNDTPSRIALKLAVLGDILKQVKMIVSYELEDVFVNLNSLLEKFNLEKIELKSFEYLIDLKKFADSLKIKNNNLIDLYNRIFDENIDNLSDSNIKVGLMYDCFFKIFNSGIQYESPINNSPMVVNLDALLEEIESKY